MKKAFAIMLAVLLMASYVALAEDDSKIFAFEEAQYEVIPKKSVSLKPISQGIEGKMKYVWESENEEIATVTKEGKVTGVSIGETAIICTGTTKNGDVHVAKCKICVKRPIEKITALEKKREFSEVVHFFGVGLFHNRAF